MKVCGFTFIRNAIKYDYPIVEAISSILPVCDSFVVAVGNSEDETRNLIGSIDRHKIAIIDTQWNDALRKGGVVLAQETDKAYRAIPPDFDWAFYIQGDEVIHEKYLGPVYNAMKKWKDDRFVDGLLFDYLHFYGSYDYIGESYRWYRREIRAIKNTKNIYSYRDAQGFRKDNNKKLRVKNIDACVYHYGWVKEPKAMQKKQLSFHKYWHNDKWVDKNIIKGEVFNYSNIDALNHFEGTHPKVMEQRIRNKNWYFDHDISLNRFSLKDKIKKSIEKLTDWRVGEYRNYRII